MVRCKRGGRLPSCVERFWSTLGGSLIMIGGAKEASSCFVMEICLGWTVAGGLYKHRLPITLEPS